MFLTPRDVSVAVNLNYFLVIGMILSLRKVISQIENFREKKYMSLFLMCLFLGT